MMTGRVVSRVLAVIGILALSATMAQAGGGQGVGNITTFFECHSIDGGNVNQVVSTHELDDASTLRHGNLRVGAGVLSCRQVDVKNSAGNFINGDLQSDELKCYTVSAKGPKAASEEVMLQDDFFAAEPVNRSPAVQMICGPALPVTTTP
jgi:hypothetical protein